MFEVMRVVVASSERNRLMPTKAMTASRSKQQPEHEAQTRTDF